MYDGPTDEWLVRRDRDDGRRSRSCGATSSSAAPRRASRSTRSWSATRAGRMERAHDQRRDHPHPGRRHRVDGLLPRASRLLQGLGVVRRRVLGGSRRSRPTTSRPSRASDGSRSSSEQTTRRCSTSRSRAAMAIPTKAASGSARNRKTTSPPSSSRLPQVRSRPGEREAGARGLLPLGFVVVRRRVQLAERRPQQPPARSGSTAETPSPPG